MNNAIARVAGLLGIAIVGAIVAARYGDAADTSVGAFHLAMAISAGLVAFGGVLGLIGIQNPERKVEASRTAPAASSRASPREAARPRRGHGCGCGGCGGGSLLGRQPDRRGSS